MHPVRQLFDTSTEIGRALVAQRPAFMQVAGFSFFINLLYLVPSIYMLQIYDRVLTSRNGMTLIMLTVMVFGLYVVFGVLDNVRGRMLLRIGGRFEEGLRARVFEAAFQRQLSRQGNGPAHAIQDIVAVRQFIAGAGAIAFLDTPWLPIFLLVITLIHPWLGLFSLLAALVLLTLTWLNELFTHKAQAEATTAAIAATLFANNNLRNAETIRAMGMLPHVMERWGTHYNRSLAMQTLAGDRGAQMGALGKFVRMLSQSLILGLGAWLAMDDHITPGGMIAASILMGRALAPVEHLIAAWKQWVAAREANKRIDDLLRSMPVGGPSLPLPPPQGNLVIENVHALPPGGKVPVIKGLSFRINAGDLVGIIGPSAAGKSCLARLLVGIWPTASGHVRLDGADVYQWNRAELGPHLGYLPQEIALFDGTVAENIARFGQPDPDKIVAAARLAGVHDLILHLPQGYETPVGTDGGVLSGGQRQRIALARALYGDPCLLVLDEPDSNLDPAGEAALQQALLASKARGATAIFIAHGSRLIDSTDKLLALRDGTLLAYGPRTQVLEHLQSLNAPRVAS